MQPGARAQDNKAFGLLFSILIDLERKGQCNQANNTTNCFNYSTFESVFVFSVVSFYSPQLKTSIFIYLKEEKLLVKTLTGGKKRK